MGETDGSAHWPATDADGQGAALAEWTWLVRLCIRFAPDRTTAEDLAQETLIVAWQRAHELRDPTARAAWLAGIARRRGLMWIRRHQREAQHLVDVQGGLGALTTSPLDDLADGVDVELQLERDELADLLDQALAALPRDTGQALVQHYVDGWPQVEVAARLGISAGAVAVRLHRGKLALRRVLTTRLRRDAATYDLPGLDVPLWQDTRLWCPRCGQRRLVGQLRPSAGELLLRCADDACAALSLDLVVEGHWDDLLVGLTSYKPALSRIMRWVDRHCIRALGTGGLIPCRRCGRATPLRPGPPAETPWRGGMEGFHVRCTPCGHTDWYPLRELFLCSPDGQRFWREHPRLRALPARAVDNAGRPAVLTRYQSMDQSAHLDVLTARETYAILDIRRSRP